MESTTFDAARLRRARFGTAVSFGVLGIALGTWAAGIPSIKHQANLSDGTLGLALLASPVGTLLALQFTGHWIVKLGSARVAQFALIATALTVLLPAFLHNLLALSAAIFVYGIAIAYSDSSINAHAVVVEQRYGRPIMSNFHAWFSVGGLAGGLFGGLAAHAGATLVQRFAMAIALMVVMQLIANRMLLPASVDAHDVSTDEPTPKAAWNKALLLAGFVTFCSFCVEGTAGDWSGVYLRDELGASVGAAASGFIAFSLAMTIWRFAGDRMQEWIAPSRMVFFGGVSIIAGILIGLSSHSIWLTAASWALVGAGTSSVAPLMFSAAGNVPGVPHGPAIAKVGGLGYLGVMLGPPIIGGIASLTSLRVALLFPVLLALMMCVLAGPTLRATRGIQGGT